MLCTFTTKDGVLVIRSDDIRAIEDEPTGKTALAWLIGDATEIRHIEGSAAENAARIQQEELDLVARVEMHRYQTHQLLQAQPVPRGKQR